MRSQQKREPQRHRDTEAAFYFHAWMRNNAGRKMLFIFCLEQTMSPRRGRQGTPLCLCVSVAPPVFSSAGLAATVALALVFVLDFGGHVEGGDALADAL